MYRHNLHTKLIQASPFSKERIVLMPMNERYELTNLGMHEEDKYTQYRMESIQL